MMQVDSMGPAFIWVDETGCDRITSLRRMAYGVRGATPENVMLQVRGKRLSAIAAMSVRGKCGWRYVLQFPGDKYLSTDAPF